MSGAGAWPRVLCCAALSRPVLQISLWIRKCGAPAVSPAATSAAGLLVLSLFVRCYLECAASLSRVWGRPFPDEGCRVRPVINARPAHSAVSLFSISLTPLTETRSVWLATLSRAVTLSHSLSIKYFPLLSMKFYTDGLTLVFDVSVRGLLTLCRRRSMLALFAPRRQDTQTLDGTRHSAEDR